MMKRLALIVLLVMAFSVSARAEDSNTLRMLVSACSKFIEYDAHKELPSATDATDIGYCAGYVNAAMQFIGAFVPTICLPPTVTTGDVMKIIVKYGNDHPERLYLYDGAQIILAVGGAFPCKK